MYDIPDLGHLLASRITGYSSRTSPLVVKQRRPVQLPKDIAEMRLANAKCVARGSKRDLSDILFSAPMKRGEQGQRPSPSAPAGPSSSSRGPVAADAVADAADLSVVDEDVCEELDHAPADVVVDMAEQLLPAHLFADYVEGQASDDQPESVSGDSGDAVDVIDAEPIAIALEPELAQGASSSAPAAAGETVDVVPAASEPAHTSDSLPVASASGAASVPNSFDPRGLDIEGPSPLHYLYRQGRSVARCQPTGRNYSVKCYLHSGCSLLVAARHQPTIEQIKQWIASAELAEPSDSKEVAQAKAARHLAGLKQLRDAAKSQPG
jgi:hypothetical protein